MTKTDKEEKIIDVALGLLKSNGDHGVTMRQVAQRAGMSLSNVQYYFKSKDELLTAMADRYFYHCLEDFRNDHTISSIRSKKKAIKNLVDSFLAYGAEISEMCKIFREYWAIATRNETIEEYLQRYYQEMANALADKLGVVSDDPQAIDAATSLLIPYTEGYSITASSLPLNAEEASKMVTELMSGILAVN